jgi:hypothetical protein
MGMPRWLHLCVLFSLGGSLAFNAYQWSHAPAAKKESHASAQEPTSGTTDPSCGSQLEACLRTANGLAAGLWSMNATSPAPSVPPQPAVEPGDAGAFSGDGVCRVARKKLREEWVSKRDLISAAMLDFLHDEKKQLADAQQGADRVADGLGLEGRARRAFETDYLDLERRRVGDLSALAGNNGPPDWSRLLDGVHTLYADEDALVQNQLGADKLATFRSVEADKRVTILSILATYANSDWDEATQGYDSPGAN